MRAVLKFIIPETQKLHQAKSILYSLLFFEIFFATDACAYVWRANPASLYFLDKSPDYF